MALLVISIIIMDNYHKYDIIILYTEIKSKRASISTLWHASEVSTIPQKGEQSPFPLEGPRKRENFDSVTSAGDEGRPFVAQFTRFAGRKRCLWIYVSGSRDKRLKTSTRREAEGQIHGRRGTKRKARSFECRLYIFVFYFRLFAET